MTADLRRPAYARIATAGNTLLVTLLTIVLLSVLSAIAFQYTSSNARIAERSAELHGAYAVADGALELLFWRWRAVMSSSSHNYTPEELKTPSKNPLGMDITRITPADLGINSSSLGNTGDAPFEVNAVTITHYDVFGRAQPDGAAIDISAKSDDSDPSKPVYVGPSPSSEAFTSFNIVYEARIWVTCNLHGRVDSTGKVTGTPVTVGVRRQFTKSLTPTMQAAIFYDGQLEIHPGSGMKVDGLVHTNNNLYAAGMKTGVDNGLNFLQHVSYNGYYNQDADGARVLTKADEALLHKIGSGSDESTWTAYKPYFNGDTSSTTNDLQRVNRMNIGGVDPDSLHADNSGNIGPDGKPLAINYNDDSYREVIERPVRNASASGDPASASYSNYYDNDPDSLAKMRIYNQASLKILISKQRNAKGKVTSVTVTVRGKNTVSADGSMTADGPDLSQVASGFVDKIKELVINADNNNKPTAMTDRREDPTASTTVDVHTIDVGQLKSLIEANMTSNDPASVLNFNGIVYVSDITGSDAATGSYADRAKVGGGFSDVETDASGNRIKHAVMLTNATDLPVPSEVHNNPDSKADRVFTLASDGAVYIKGDYNTGGSGSTVPSNVNQTTIGADGTETANSTYASGYTPVTSAIMADAVTAVSRNFDPTYAGMGIYTEYTTDKDLAAAYPEDFVYTKKPTLDGQLVRGAVPTTINTAVLSGNTPTDDATGVSSGGAESLIRLLENWKGPGGDKAFTYNGSLMQGFSSKEFIGAWKVANVYENPKRLFSFDKNLLSTRPAGSPYTVQYTRGKWERFPDPVPKS